jgi:hypothetical protein
MAIYFMDYNFVRIQCAAGTHGDEFIMD